MGNRAVITAGTVDDIKENPQTSADIGVYLHWNGGRNTVEALLAFCEAKGYRHPAEDDYGWARLCQVAGNMLGEEVSLGVDRCDQLDCDNSHNGTYIIGGYSGWSIIGRRYFAGIEQGERDSVSELYAMMQYINDRQPKAEQLTDEVLARFAVKHYNEWHNTAIEWVPEQKPKKPPLEFISVKDRLPEQSCYVVALAASSGWVQTLAYSAKHKAFNCQDYDDEPKYAIKVAYWMPMEALPEVKQEDV